MKIFLALLLLIPSLSWGYKFKSIWDETVGVDGVWDYELSLQVYSGPESDDRLSIVIWPPSITGIELVNIARYQFTNGELDWSYQGKEDFICLKSIFEKAVEWAEIAETNSIEYIEKEIDNHCEFRGVAFPPDGAITGFKFESELWYLEDDDGPPLRDTILYLTFFINGVFFEMTIYENKFKEILDVFNNLENHFQDFRNNNLKMEKESELFQ
jgi:hypothetical protein